MRVCAHEGKQVNMTQRTDEDKTEKNHATKNGAEQAHNKG